jgi:hypothetical protein
LTAEVMLRLCFAEELDVDFIRWTSNLLRNLSADRTVALVGQSEGADAMLASIWRPHAFPAGIPVILVSNENWRVFAPHAALSRYAAVLGICEPPEPCNFIRFPYAAAHFDLPIAALRLIRAALLRAPKTKFCCFVASNGVGELGQARRLLAQRLHAWKGVDSAGRIDNNVGYLAPRGLEFLSWIAQYRYMLCLENSRAPGYITEKPYQAWLSGSVPIYDGGCLQQLNSEAIVDASQADLQEVLARLEAEPAHYERKRHADIGLALLSTDEFENRFRAFVRQFRGCVR